MCSFHKLRNHYDMFMFFFLIEQSSHLIMFNYVFFIYSFIYLNTIIYIILFIWALLKIRLHC